MESPSDDGFRSLYSHYDGVLKQDTNAVIADFFVVHGMKDIYELFVSESGQDVGFLEERSSIIDSIMNGSIRDSLSRLNSIDSMIVRDSDTGVGFYLQLQALIELIRQEKSSNSTTGTMNASSPTSANSLAFAQQQVAPLAQNKSEFISEIERVMSLLLYRTPDDSPDSNYLTDAHREKVASIANRSILKFAKLPTKTKLESLLKMILWSHQRAEEEHVKVAKMKDIVTADVEYRNVAASLGESVPNVTSSARTSTAQVAAGLIMQAIDQVMMGYYSPPSGDDDDDGDDDEYNEDIELSPMEEYETVEDDDNNEGGREEAEDEGEDDDQDLMETSDS